MLGKKERERERERLREGERETAMGAYYAPWKGKQELIKDLIERRESH